MVIDLHELAYQFHHVEQRKSPEAIYKIAAEDQQATSKEVHAWLAMATVEEAQKFLQQIKSRTNDWQQHAMVALQVAIDRNNSGWNTRILRWAKVGCAIGGLGVLLALVDECAKYLHDSNKPNADAEQSPPTTLLTNTTSAVLTTSTPTPATPPNSQPTNQSSTNTTPELTPKNRMPEPQATNAPVPALPPTEPPAPAKSEK